ncbi:MAG TPA: UDP-4-amino-4,6-dideoxy-N-acetyl-beta-L-altrosamine transaminase [Anaerolineales bacterium]|jgi:UDP-4-amino-4,6-dideoxy-N-acetyl-beta-L-altrosamine transaminase
MIPYGRQHVTDEDISAVVAILRSDFLTQGPLPPQFQRAIAARCGAAHAVAANSATSALHLACMALGLGNGDWLWTSPITFVASANCGLYCGAKIDFVDIDPRTYNMCPRALERKLAVAEREGRLPKILIPVHFAGQSCDMTAIYSLAQRYGVRIIEDASHAIGATFRAEPVGNCRYSDITVFSFHPVKIITTAEGGMAVTNSDHLAGRMARLATHGITRNPSLMTHEPDGDWYYQQVDLGFNYRLTDLQAALGLSQLSRLEAYVERRHQIAQRYNHELAALPVQLPYQAQDGRSALHLYPIRIDSVRFDRKQVFDALRREGVGVNVHYIPVYSQPYYQSFGFVADDFPEAERYYAGALSIPMYPTMTDQQQDHVIAAVIRVLQ